MLKWRYGALKPITNTVRSTWFEHEKLVVTVPKSRPLPSMLRCHSLHQYLSHFNWDGAGNGWTKWANNHRFLSFLAAGTPPVSRSFTKMPFNCRMNFKLYSILYGWHWWLYAKECVYYHITISEQNTNIKPAYIKRKRFNVWQLILEIFRTTTLSI